MTLGDLKALLAQSIGLDATTADGLVAFWDRDLLNGAAQEIATALKIPRGEAVFSKADLEAGPVSLPTGVREVLRVIIPPDYVVPIVTSDDYQDDGSNILPTVSYEYPYVAIVQGTTFRLGKPDRAEYPQYVKVLYFADPAPMVNETDVPWNGKYEPYHRLIALRAAMDALLLLNPGSEGEGEVALRYRRVADRYNELLADFKAHLDQIMYIGRRDLRSTMYARGGRYA